MSFAAKRRRGNKKVLGLLLFAVAVVTMAGVAVSRIFKCDFFSEAPVWSPDGKWVVKAATRACPAGLLSVTNYDVSVVVASGTGAGSSATSPVPIFESAGAADPPSARWRSSNALELELREEGTVTTSRHEVGKIKVVYVVPMWMWRSLSSIESDRLRENRQSEELFKAGKMSSGDLQIELEITASVAAERTRFREWVVENATVEGVAPGETQSRR